MRLIALVDGHNVYHSLCAAEEELEKLDRFNVLHGKSPQAMQGRNFHWFDIPGCVAAHLSAIGGGAVLAQTVYFSAYATHVKDQRRVERHELYVEALKGSGVRTEMFRFKPKEVRCDVCRGKSTRHEEKETDVALAVELIAAALDDSIDGYVIMSGDTDQLPAIRAAQRIAPHKPLYFLFPFQRQSKSLERMSRKSWKLDLRAYDRHRWPKQLALPDGRIIERPAEYDG